MENIPVFGQTSQLLASGIIILALCLGIIFYFWSLNLYKRIEQLITRMRKNIDNLEKLSQSIYETAYFELKKSSKQPAPKQTRMIQRSEESSNREPENKTVLSSKPESIQFSQPAEKDKFQNISDLIIRYFGDLVKEKEQVTAQELIYAMPNQYSLADIYRTLEAMKEKGQISWEERNISPQSILKMK
jgi:hypothetical protein